MTLLRCNDIVNIDKLVVLWLQLDSEVLESVLSSEDPVAVATEVAEAIANT